MSPFFPVIGKHPIESFHYWNEKSGYREKCEIEKVQLTSNTNAKCKNLRTNNYHCLVIVASLLFSIFSGCSNPEHDWQNALSINSIPAYEEFLEKHLNSQYSDSAKMLIEGLMIQNAWDSANTIGDANSYAEFLKKYPYSQFAEDAQKKLMQTKEISASEICDYNIAVRENLAWLMQDFTSKYTGSAYIFAMEQLLNGFKHTYVDADIYISFDTLRLSLGWNGESHFTCGSISETTTIQKDGERNISYTGKGCLGNIQLSGSFSGDGEGFRFLTPTIIWTPIDRTLPSFVPDWIGPQDQKDQFYENSQYSVTTWQIGRPKGPDGKRPELEDHRLAELLRCMGYNAHNQWHSATWHYTELPSDFTGSIMVIYADGMKSHADKVAEALYLGFPSYHISIKKKGTQQKSLSTNFPLSNDIVVAFRLLEREQQFRKD